MTCIQSKVSSLVGFISIHHEIGLKGRRRETFNIRLGVCVWKWDRGGVFGTATCCVTNTHTGRAHTQSVFIYLYLYIIHKRRVCHAQVFIVKTQPSRDILTQGSFYIDFRLCPPPSSSRSLSDVEPCDNAETIKLLSLSFPPVSSSSFFQ